MWNVDFWNFSNLRCHDSLESTYLKKKLFSIPPVLIDSHDKMYLRRRDITNAFTNIKMYIHNENPKSRCIMPQANITCFPCAASLNVVTCVLRTAFPPDNSRHVAPGAILQFDYLYFFWLITLICIIKIRCNRTYYQVWTHTFGDNMPTKTVW